MDQKYSVYGVPKQWCAEEYAAAVDAYSKKRNRSALLKEIHFVDISDEMLSEMNKAFKEVFKDGDDEFKMGRARHKSESTNLREIKVDQPKQSYYMKDGNKSVFELKQDFKVIVYTGDITKFNTGVIACNQDSQLKSAGRIAGALKSKAGSSFQESLNKYMYRKGKKLKTGDIVVTDPGTLSCAGVYHVVSPDFTTQMGQSISDAFLQDMQRGYVNCLLEAQKRGIAKIAVPLFGCGLLSDKIEKLVETFHNAVISFCTDPDIESLSLKEIHAINDKEGVTHKIKIVFLDYIKEVAEDHYSKTLDGNFDDQDKSSQDDRDRGKSDHGEADGKSDGKKMDGMKFPDTDTGTEKCPICMDNFDNPKKLPKCGHVFCAECIEAQFKVTPKCPNCFMVYGEITGDQPEGEIRFTTDYRTKLKGYEKYDTIVITYDFPDGVQGPDHPNPGTPYKGIRRQGYLPDNKDGRLILEMLKIAFERKLVFTIGSSRTTGREGVITWNDIHHKTDPRPYSTFGYPDDTYLTRVKEELSAKGVTPEDIP